jgi:hypothetical protein
MALTGKSLIVLLTVILACATAALADQERPKFTPGPASSYDTRQTISNVTIAAVPYSSEAQTDQAFGKLNPNKEGVLPILVVIQNDTKQTITLDQLKVELVTADRDRILATPAADLKYLSGPDRPKVYTSPIPGGTPRIGKKKNPLAAWEIEGRAFSARMLAPKDSASGFFYFRAPYRSGSTLYITGLREASSGKELFYFEVPLEKREATEIPEVRPERKPRRAPAS